VAVRLPNPQIATTAESAVFSESVLMQSDAGFLQGFGYIEVVLPNRDLLKVEPLGIKTTVSLIRKAKQIAGGDEEALIGLCEELIAVINPPEARAVIERLQPMELMDLAFGFFYAARAGAAAIVGVKPIESPQTKSEPSNTPAAAAPSNPPQPPASAAPIGTAP
jgi:hypothetical protein